MLLKILLTSTTNLSVRSRRQKDINQYEHWVGNESKLTRIYNDHQQSKPMNYTSMVVDKVLYAVI